MGGKGRSVWGRGGECMMKEEGRKDVCKKYGGGEGDGMGKRRFMCLRDI